jgi:hypothetical protein
LTQAARRVHDSEARSREQKARAHVAKPTPKQYAAICADLEKFYNERPDDLRKLYAVRVEGLLDGLLGGLDRPIQERLCHHYDKGHRVGLWIRSQVRAPGEGE